MEITEQEKVLVSLGAKRYQKKLQQLKDNNLSELTDIGSSVISRNLSKVSKSLKEELLPPDMLAYIGLSTVLNHLTPDYKVLPLCNRIGKAIIQEHNAQLLKLDPKLSRRKVIEELRKHVPVKISKRKCLQIGSDVLNAIMDNTNIIQYSKIYQKGKTYRTVNATEEFELEYEGLLKNNLNLEPLRKPISAFPIPVNEKLVGGYAHDVLNNVSSLAYRTKDQLDSMIASDKLSSIRSVLNCSQSIPYSLDEKVYEIGSYLFEQGTAIAGLPKSTSNMMPEYDEDKFKFFQAKEQVNSLKGKRYNVARTLGIAADVKELDHFYFPAYLDFRGRLYYRGDYLNPQGNDLAKALLKFTSTSVIDDEAKWWYYIHGANCYGVKGTYQKRYNFIQEREHEIRQIAADPIKSLDLWKDTDSPFSYLAFVLDCNAYLDDPQNYQSGLRIASDASSSGIQVLSLLLRDEEGCVRTNVLPHTTTAEPSDVYIECLGVLKGLLTNDAQSNLKPVSEYALYWLEELKNKNSRDLVKRILMTSVYSLSLYGLNKYVQDWINENSECECKFHIKYLKSRVKEAVDETVKGASQGMLWLKEVTRQLATLNKDLELTLPSGFKLVSRYRKSKASHIKTITQGKFVYIQYQNETDKIAPGKSINASVPNVIHALDANILYDIVEKIPNNVPFSLVHDSIYYRASDANLFYEQIRSSIKEIFTPDILQDFKEQIEEQHSITLPNIPEQGTINFDDILEAPYIYH